MSEQKQERKVYLSERWTKVAAVLPDYFGSGSGHPNLLVDPSGFRRIVEKSLMTCNEFLEMLAETEDAIEERIQGITSFYNLSKLMTTKETGGYMSMVSGATALAVGVSGETRQTPTTTPPPRREDAKGYIIKKIGDTWLYGGRELETDERISMEKGLSILRKCESLRNTALECIATFGSLNEVLEVGKVFGTRETVVYFEHGDRHLSEKTEQTELIPLYSYWTPLSNVHRMRSMIKKLTPILTEGH